MTEPVPVEVTMFTRPECHLCERAAAVIRDVRTRVPFEFNTVDIEEDPELEARHGTRIPVVHINGHPAFQYRVDADALEKAITRLWKK